MGTAKVGIREFRENLSGYLESSEPVAITRHGQTIGVYMPTRRKISAADLEKFRESSERLRALMEEAGITEDEVVEEFERLRRARRNGK